MSQEIKRRLHAICLAKVATQLTTLEAGLEQSRAVANSSQKSSAGDKHETTRAMAHLEQERYAQMLREAFALQRQLSSIDPSIEHEEAELGALIYTAVGAFYIAAGIGEIDLDGQSFWVVSPQAPLAEELEGLQEGEHFVFRKRRLEILEIE